MTTPTLSFRPQALAQLLAQDGLLVRTDGDEHHPAVLRSIHGQDVRWWRFPVDTLGDGYAADSAESTEHVIFPSTRC